MAPAAPPDLTGGRPAVALISGSEIVLEAAVDTTGGQEVLRSIPGGP